MQYKNNVFICYTAGMLVGRGRMVTFVLLLFLIISGIVTFFEISKSESLSDKKIDSAKTTITTISPAQSLKIITPSHVLTLKPSGYLSAKSLPAGKKEQALVLK